MSEESEDSDVVWAIVKVERVVERLDSCVDRVCKEGGADGG